MRFGGATRYVTPLGNTVYRYADGQRVVPYNSGMFFSPFESGYKGTGWRWYWKFLRDYPNMVRTVEADCFAALCYNGLVTA